MADTASNPASSHPSESTQDTTQPQQQQQPEPQPQPSTPSKPASSSEEKQPSSSPKDASAPQYSYIQYDPSRETTYVSAMQQLIMTELSEPYSIYVYRYFLYQWGELCFMCYDTTTNPPTLAGCIISKLEPHTSPSGTSPFPPTLRGYIAMLAVPHAYRGRGIATRLVRMAIDAMAARDADEVVLETEVSNVAAIKLYQRLGFLRSKRLHRYYLSGGSAFRLVLPLREGAGGIGGYGGGLGGQGVQEEGMGVHVC